MNRFYVPGLALGGWTVLLWFTRVRNVLADTALEGWSRTWQLGISVIFVVVAVVLIGLSLVKGNPAVRTMAIRVSLGLAAFGSVWWAIRGVNTMFNDHSVAFKLVHAVLAIGTIAISAWVLNGQRRRLVAAELV
ncbi:MAG: hypothetical protein R2710_17225 [Acidimicrobiales bacterium]